VHGGARETSVTLGIGSEHHSGVAGLATLRRVATLIERIIPNDLHDGRNTLGVPKEEAQK
jgi:hypothetical protein